MLFGKKSPEEKMEKLVHRKDYICHMDTDNTGILLIDGHR